MNSIPDDDLEQRQSAGCHFSILLKIKVLDTVHFAGLERSFRAWCVFRTNLTS